MSSRRGKNVIKFRDVWSSKLVGVGQLAINGCTRHLPTNCRSVQFLQIMQQIKGQIRVKNITITKDSNSEHLILRNTVVR